MIIKNKIQNRLQEHKNLYTTSKTSLIFSSSSYGRVWVLCLIMFQCISANIL